MEINIAYGVDENYTKYACISLFSLLMNIRKGNTIKCYLITTQSNKYSRYMKNLEKTFPFYTFHEIIVDVKHLKDIPTSLPHLNYSAFFRFSIENLIKGVEKIIYIDADTLITGDISELYNINLEGNIAGVISDQPDEYVLKVMNQLPGKREKYFNSGVMLIDIKKRKDLNVSKKCLDLLKKNRFPTDDQDALNIVLGNHCKWLDGKYNVVKGYFFENEKDFHYIGFERQYYLDAVANPIVIHFTSMFKPWMLISIHPYTGTYANLQLKFLKYGYIFSFKEYIYAIIHIIEYFIFPKHETRIKIRDFVLRHKK